MCCLTIKIVNIESSSRFNDTGSTGERTLDATRHCILMDEVDGMAGNEDRGGIQVAPPGDRR